MKKWTLMTYLRMQGKNLLWKFNYHRQAKIAKWSTKFLLLWFNQMNKSWIIKYNKIFMIR